MFVNIPFLLAISIIVIVFGWLIRVAYWIVPIIGRIGKRVIDIFTFIGSIAHFTGHVIGGYLADQNFRMVYRAHPSFSYAAGYLVPATYQKQAVSRSNVTQEDIQSASLFMNLRRTATVVLMPFPFILLLMGITYILFSTLVDATGLSQFKLVYFWVHLSLAYHLLPDDEDLYSIYNSLIMLHAGSLLLGFAGVCGAVFIFLFGTQIWNYPSVATAIVTYTPFSPGTFGFLVSILFVVFSIVLIILHVNFKKVSGKSKQIADNAWLNTVYLWKLKHGRQWYSPLRSTEEPIVSKKPFTTKRFVWTGIKLLLLIIGSFIAIGFIMLFLMF
ncbi:MAG: hypothetical protein ACFFCD_04345 [Promethearchaeota archaeon]